MGTWGDVAVVIGGGAAGAAIIKAIESIILHKMQRAAKKEDDATEEEAAKEKSILQDVEDLKKRTARDYARLNTHDDMLENSEQSIQALLKAVNALLLHNMTGNASGKMAEAQKNLVDHIIEKGGH